MGQPQLHTATKPDMKKNGVGESSKPLPGLVPIEELFPKGEPLTPEQRTHLIQLGSRNLIEKFPISEEEAREFMEAYLDGYNESIEAIKFNRELMEKHLKRLG